jgi:L-asparagine oxygenase
MNVLEDGTTTLVGVPLLTLDADERRQVADVVQRLEERYTDSEDPRLLRDLPVLLHDLPESLVRWMADMRVAETTPVTVVDLLDVDDAVIGPSPLQPRTAPERGSSRREEFAVVLLASLLGDVFSFGTLQGGRLVHDLAPIPSESTEQSGYSSDSTLEPHNEDHFHPLRADYLVLLCLRNPDAVPTEVVTFDALDLSPEHVAVLRQPRYRLIADPTHLEGGADPRGWAAPQPLLFGDPGSTYGRVDPFFTECLPGDAEAQEAADALAAQLVEHVVPVALRPGQALVIDNYRAAHGRRPFRPRFDGTDRWLKRVSVARDLRRSRAQRRSAASRVIHL